MMPTQNGSQKVQLGCGTLILIALIVLFFSNSNSSRTANLEAQIHNLQSQIDKLQNSIDSQTVSIADIQTKVDAIKSRN